MELIRLYDPKSVDIEGEIPIIYLRLVKITIISVTALLKVKLFDHVLITSRKIACVIKCHKEFKLNLSFQVVININFLLPILFKVYYKQAIGTSLQLLFLPTFSSNTLSSLKLLILHSFPSNPLSS